MHADRLAACQQRLADSPADAAVFAPGANLTYLTGFETEASERALFLFVTSDAVEFFVPELVEEQVAASTPIDQIRTWRDDETPHKPLSALCADLGLAGDDTRLLIDETMWARFTHLLRDVFPQATVGLATELMAELRIRKDDAELAALRRAAAAADTAMMRLRDRGDDLVGLTESAVATRIETWQHGLRPNSPMPAASRSRSSRLLRQAHTALVHTTPTATAKSAQGNRSCLISGVASTAIHRIRREPLCLVASRQRGSHRVTRSFVALSVRRLSGSNPV